MITLNQYLPIEMMRYCHIFHREIQQIVGLFWVILYGNHKISTWSSKYNYRLIEIPIMNKIIRFWERAGAKQCKCPVIVNDVKIMKLSAYQMVKISQADKQFCWTLWLNSMSLSTDKCEFVFIFILMSLFHSALYIN